MSKFCNKRHRHNNCSGSDGSSWKQSHFEIDWVRMGGLCLQLMLNRFNLRLDLIWKFIISCSFNDAFGRALSIFRGFNDSNFEWKSQWKFNVQLEFVIPKTNVVHSNRKRTRVKKVKLCHITTKLQWYSGSNWINVLALNRIRMPHLSCTKRSNRKAKLHSFCNGRHFYQLFWSWSLRYLMRSEKKMKRKWEPIH